MQEKECQTESPLEQKQISIWSLVTFSGSIRWINFQLFDHFHRWSAFVSRWGCAFTIITAASLYTRSAHLQSLHFFLILWKFSQDGECLGISMSSISADFQLNLLLHVDWDKWKWKNENRDKLFHSSSDRVSQLNDRPT